MTRIKRTYLAFGAWTAWAGAAAVTAIAPFADVADEHPFLVQRVFALLALAATVMSVAWLIDKARKPVIPVPAETTYELGIEVGKDIGRMEAALGRWNDPTSGRGRHPLAGEVGQQRDTPPYMWRG